MLFLNMAVSIKVSIIKACFNIGVFIIMDYFVFVVFITKVNFSFIIKIDFFKHLCNKEMYYFDYNLKAFVININMAYFFS